MLGHQKYVSLARLHDDRCSFSVAGSTLKVIGTHNGTFHCDEALAVYMLRLTEAYQDAGYSDCL